MACRAFNINHVILNVMLCIMESTKKDVSFEYKTQFRTYLDA